jgi:hypothetical protein
VHQDYGFTCRDPLVGKRPDIHEFGSVSINLQGGLYIVVPLYDLINLSFHAISIALK